MNQSYMLLLNTFDDENIISRDGNDTIEFKVNFDFLPSHIDKFILNFNFISQMRAHTNQPIENISPAQLEISGMSGMNIFTNKSSRSNIVGFLYPQNRVVVNTEPLTFFKASPVDNIPITINRPYNGSIVVSVRTQAGDALPTVMSAYALYLDFKPIL
jgi:hypothetical protein